VTLYQSSIKSFLIRLNVTDNTPFLTLPNLTLMIPLIGFSFMYMPSLFVLCYRFRRSCSLLRFSFRLASSPSIAVALPLIPRTITLILPTFSSIFVTNVSALVLWLLIEFLTPNVLCYIYCGNWERMKLYLNHLCF
jgi:hypothetical protein